MTALLLIRHGPTEWNAIGRVQGSTDVPLSPEGRAFVGTLAVPAEFADYDWVTSPLARATETARILGAEAPKREPRLAEMHWGEWEGETLDALRARYGDAMIENETRGLDFRAPGGESPRDVQARLSAWTAEVAARGRPTIATAHKGVIRAMLALATDWDMIGKPPLRLDFKAAQLFTLDAAGSPAVARINIDLGAP